MLCLRLDVDTVADCLALPEAVSILGSYDAKATFFVSTGFDRAGLNFPGYMTRPWRLLRNRVWARYGVGNIIASLANPRRVESLVDFRGIQRAGHEVALHGYEHTLWIRDFRMLGREELERRIEKGRKAFVAAAGFEPMGFASPGFTVSEDLLLALEGFGFSYSSDFLGDKPFRPVVADQRLRTPQIPVAVDIERAVAKLGPEKYLRRLEEMGGVVVAYMHPSYCRVVPGILEKTLERTGSFTTFGEVARSIKR